MSIKLLDLSDRFVTSTGEVVFSYDGLLKLARDGHDFHKYLVDLDDYVERYNRYSSNKLEGYHEDEDGDDIPDFFYEWNTPKEYTSIDLMEKCALRLEELDLTNDTYMDRLVYELDEFEKRDMVPLVQHLIYLIDHFKKNNVVWGVGRGSSCASLILFLIGLNKIDPVSYDIPVDEFLR